jgi:cellulose biosynthesis protein BcsQ
MVQKIALFNHKGGVSKTTTTYYLGWMLASKGKRVILVDTDPQCNLTGIALRQITEEDEDRLAQIYNTHSNIKTGLAPAFESQPRAIQAVDCIEIKEGLFLLPGHVGFAEYEVTLGIAQELSGSIQALKNLPGSITDLLQKTADKFNADYILIDMSPSLSSINQNLLMTSDFFIIPTSADLFSLMAINSLTNVLPKWYHWATKASNMTILKEANYPFPDINLKFLGTIMQNFRIIGGKETKAFQKWVQAIDSDVTHKLVPVLQENNLLLSRQDYLSQNIGDNFCLTKIANFNSLIAVSQECGIPVYDLTLEKFQHAKNKEYQDKLQGFTNVFSNLADKIINLTSTHAVCA